MNISPVGQNVISDYGSYQISPDVSNDISTEQFEFVNAESSSDQEFNRKELDKSLNKLNKFLEDDNVHAEYSVHDTFSTIMIKIVDDKTKQVILEIPPKKILDMIASMCKQFGILDKKA